MRELFREFALAHELREEAYDRDVRLAWWTVRIYAEFRTKRLPSLASLLRRTPATPPQVTRTTLEGLSRLYGGRVRTVTQKVT